MRLKEPERGRFEVVEAPTAPPLLADRAPAVGDPVAALPVDRLRLHDRLDPRHQPAGRRSISADEFGVRPGARGVLIAIGTVLSVVGVLVGTTVAQRRTQRKPSGGLRLLCWTAVGRGRFSARRRGRARISRSRCSSSGRSSSSSRSSLPACVRSPRSSRRRRSARARSRSPGLIALAGAPFAFIGLADRRLERALGDGGDGAGLPPRRPVLLPGRRRTSTTTSSGSIPPTSARARDAGALGPVLLETSGLTVSYDGVQVLFGVDLEVRRGEIVALLGTNGAGKSTTLNAISGIVEPDGGNVWFDGEAVTGEPPERTAARGIMQVPGGRGVFPGLTVEENLKMGCFLIRRDTDARRRADGRGARPVPAARRADAAAGRVAVGRRAPDAHARAVVPAPSEAAADRRAVARSRARARAGAARRGPRDERERHHDRRRRAVGEHRAHARRPRVLHGEGRGAVLAARRPSCSSAATCCGRCSSKAPELAARGC